MSETIINVALTADKRAVRIVDQTLLPNELRYIELREREAMYEAIYTLRVRGAPAIGIFAAYCIAVLAQDYPKDKFFDCLETDCDYLNKSRPTAVNLAAQLARMKRFACAHKDAADLPALLIAEAQAIYDEDVAMCRAIAEAGLSLLHEGDTVLTHCNAGPLATSQYGTGLGPLLLAAERGMDIKAYMDETRPLLQGARLTAFELQNAGLDCTLICDNMASLAMKQGRIQAVMVGCDRMARNGDFANKIGTSGLAVLCKHYGIPFYVLLPSSTIDLACPDGAHIPIEERRGEEIGSLWYEKPMAPEGIQYWNPAFDVTDHTLVTAAITEKGVMFAPCEEKIKETFA